MQAIKKLFFLLNSATSVGMRSAENVEGLMNLTPELETLRAEFFECLGSETFREPFSLARFVRLTAGQVNLMPAAQIILPKDFGNYRCLNLLIQRDGGEVRLPDELPNKEILLDIVNVTLLYSAFIPTRYRYLYLTIDTRFVRAGETQRTPGWHVDGIQGDEVPLKQRSDLTFSWCDCLPMRWANQSFELPAHVNVSEYNVFECLSQLVRPECIEECDANILYAMNSYCVHRSSVAQYDTPRTFLRLSYTNVPVTNVQMTLNPRMTYDYQVHSSAGKIPKHLKTEL